MLSGPTRWHTTADGHTLRLLRWATWLTAVTYYADNFNSIKSVISELDDESDSKKKAKELFDNQSLKNDLACIKSNFCFLSQVVV